MKEAKMLEMILAINLKDKIWFSCEAKFEKFKVINFAKRRVVANRYLSAMGHSISIVSYFQVDKGCGDHLASIFDTLMSD